MSVVVTFLSLGLVPYLYSPFSLSCRNVPARFYIPSFCGLDSSALSLMYYLKSQLLSALVTFNRPWTVSPRCFLSRQANWKWQKSLEANWTFPRKRYVVLFLLPSRKEVVIFSLLAGLWPLPRKAFAKLVVSLLPLMDIKLTISWISSSHCGPHS